VRLSFGFPLKFMSFNNFISVKNSGISPDKSLFDKSSSLNCVSLVMSDVMVPFNPLAFKFKDIIRDASVSG
jgi:hypothetical protein